MITTPYHGCIWNLALALSGRLDAHFGALWDHGHITFWSRKTLVQLVREVGFGEVEMHHVSRLPGLSKSMIAIARKSSSKRLAPAGRHETHACS